VGANNEFWFGIPLMVSDVIFCLEPNPLLAFGEKSIATGSNPLLAFGEKSIATGCNFTLLHHCNKHAR